MTPEELSRNIKLFWNDIEKDKINCERDINECPYFLRSRCAYHEKTVHYDGLCLILEDILRHKDYEVFGEDND